MKNKHNTKKFIIIILIIVIIGAIIWSIGYKNNDLAINEKENNIIKTEKKIENLCYYKEIKNQNNFYDKAWIKMEIQGEKIIGEFRHLPAETDSKVGLFEGIIGPFDKKNMSKKVKAWWNSKAEGMEVREELEIQIKDQGAMVGFGEMVNRGDGVYVYKDKNNLNYIDIMKQIDCELLNEKLYVENFIKDNIVNLATNQSVLGGVWYVISVSVDPKTKTGEVIYEDGHILSNANIEYVYKNRPQNVVITKFEIK